MNRFCEGFSVEKLGRKCLEQVWNIQILRVFPMNDGDRKGVIEQERINTMTSVDGEAQQFISVFSV
jgi:hypothetical protein